MNEEVVVNSIQGRESSFQHPRFLGVPRDDQLLEGSSSEGILHGRSISEVHSEDSEALAKAGITWERAGHVLTCLGASMTYVAETQRSTERHAFYVSPHFKNIRAQDKHSRFQFDNPIQDAGARGDPVTPLETIADEIEDFGIEFESQEKEAFSTSVNPLTLYLATAHHLLEKGNRYALTGEQLATIVEQFDEESFNADAELQAWMAEKAKEIGGPYKAITRHQETVKFIDGIAFDLSVNRNGALWITADQTELDLLQYGIDESSQELNNIGIYSDRFTIGVERREDGWRMIYPKIGDSGKENDYHYVEEEIPQDSTIWPLIEIGTNLVNRAKVQQDGVLDDSDAQALHELVTKGMNLPNTART